MKRAVWTFGLICGGMMAVMMLLTMPFIDTMDGSIGYLVGYTTMVVAFLMIFFGVRSYRDTVGGGTVGFGRAMAIGALITIIASVCYTATWEVIFFKISPDISTRMANAAERQIRASGANAAEMQKRLDDSRKFQEMYRNPAVNAAMTMIEPLPVGLVMTLFSAGVLSRKRRQTSAAPA